jgi:hypothetical protein
MKGLLDCKSETSIASSMISHLDNGNFVAYACGPLVKERYINEKMEEELLIFKKEVEN